MIETAVAAFQLPDVRRKILFTIGLLIVFRAVAHIPLPGVNTELLADFFAGNQLLGFMNLLSGGALENFSVVALGVYPYVTANIASTVLVPLIPPLQELSREGESGRRKIAQWTRLATIPFAMLQGFGQIQILRSAQQGLLSPTLGPFDIFVMLIVMTAGTMFLLWIGELITENGIGNGVSIIIFAGIVAGAPAALGQSLFAGENIGGFIAVVIIGLIMIAAIVFVQEAQRRIPVHYAKRIRGTRMYGGQSTHIPLKVNSAGMIPLIFAFSLMLLPATVASYFETSEISWLANAAGAIALTLSPSNAIYWVFTFLLVIIFTYVYTLVVFQQQNLAENLQKNGGFIPGIRPGRPTHQYLTGVVNRITLAGAVFLGIIAVVPFVAQTVTGADAVAISSTGMLIVVGVVLDTMRQLESQLMMRNYEGFIR
ncbi:MAG: preprotein translocase subunit SecY [Chloroflexota bacterium]|nr:preprotein translocase subunit SecY [Chloroflexota bacterium]MDE2918538.1 preprotein translocase subunit SecY [Chloroflexota bacterium]